MKKTTVASSTAHLCRSCFRAVVRGEIPRAQAGVAHCPTCRNCKSCGCMCRGCRECGKRVPNSPSTYCSHCQACKRCDQCRKMPQFIALHPPPSTSYHLNTLPRTLGLELELSDWGKLRAEGEFHHLRYDQAHDWSVQPSGLEMVIKPLMGDQYLRAINELAEQLYRTGAKVNESCAYHVHVNGSDLSYWDLRRILRVYESLEGEIYDHLILPHRRDVPIVTHYCQMLTRPHKKCDRCVRFDGQYPGARKALIPLRDALERMNAAKSTTELKKELIYMLYGPIGFHRPDSRDAAAWLQQRKGGRYEWCRYVGLNLHAWMYRGTVEFRMKEASTTLDELLIWPLWCGWFIQACATMREQDSIREPWTLLHFTEAFMPRWITEWVSRKICEKDKPKMEPVTPTEEATFTARMPARAVHAVRAGEERQPTMAEIQNRIQQQGTATDVVFGQRRTR
jgi:hypothetical protein